MNHQRLNIFLLDAAQQPWDLWWTATRLIFADWLEENGEPDKAGTLRAMECEVTDHIRPEGKVTTTFVIDDVVCDEEESRRAIPIVIEGFRDKRQPADWFRLADGGFFLSLGYVRWLSIANSMSEVRFHLPEPPPFPLSYMLHATDGAWHGTLSLDRAQRRCRRRVLEMFPDWCHHKREATGFIAGFDPIDQVLCAIGNSPLIVDDSPRWVPFERRPQTNDIASTMLSLTREHGLVITEMLESVISPVDP